jgi:hypothetical protein
MFGHQDDQADQQHNNHLTDTAAIDTQPQPAVATDAWQQPGAESENTHSPAYNPTVGSPAGVSDDVPITTVSTSPSTVAADPAAYQSSGPVAGDGTNDLLDIKQHALSELSPLVDHLEQSPEEKFRTTMMMIQATDNHELVKEAYAAAQSIPDEKAKAQALLDVINEINYFTQQAA